MGRTRSIQKGSGKGILLLLVVDDFESMFEFTDKNQFHTSVARLFSAYNLTISREFEILGWGLPAVHCFWPCR